MGINFLHFTKQKKEEKNNKCEKRRKKEQNCMWFSTVLSDTVIQCTVHLRIAYKEHKECERDKSLEKGRKQKKACKHFVNSQLTFLKHSKRKAITNNTKFDVFCVQCVHHWTVNTSKSVRKIVRSRKVLKRQTLKFTQRQIKNPFRRSAWDALNMTKA